MLFTSEHVNIHMQTSQVLPIGLLFIQYKLQSLHWLQSPSHIPLDREHGIPSPSEMFKREKE